MRVTCVLCVALIVACGPGRKSGDDDGSPDALIECMPEDSHRCQGATYQTCTGGTWHSGSIWRRHAAWSSRC